MGNNIIRYYGAYAKCKIPIEDTEVQKTFCDKCKLNYNEKDMFCTKCGGKLSVKIEKKRIYNTFHFNVVDYSKERLAHYYFDKNLKDYAIFSDNECDQNCGIILSSEEDMIVEFNTKDYYITNFNEKFEKEIEYMKKHYDSVNIKCGYIQCSEK